MTAILAYADSGDSSPMSLSLVLGGLLALAVVAALAAAVIFIAIARRHRRSEFLMFAVFWWAVIAAGSIIDAGISRADWQKEYLIQLESPHFDPQTAEVEPRLPWALWAGLAAAYAGMIGWSLSAKPPPAPPES